MWRSLHMLYCTCRHILLYVLLTGSWFSALSMWHFLIDCLIWTGRMQNGGSSKATGRGGQNEGGEAGRCASRRCRRSSSSASNYLRSGAHNNIQKITEARGNAHIREESFPYVEVEHHHMYLWRNGSVILYSKEFVSWACKHLKLYIDVKIVLELSEVRNTVVLAWWLHLNLGQLFFTQSVDFSHFQRSQCIFFEWNFYVHRGQTLQKWCEKQCIIL